MTHDVGTVPSGAAGPRTLETSRHPGLDVGVDPGAGWRDTGVAAAAGARGGVVMGVGVDLVHVTGFAEQLALPGSRFAEVFTPGERRDAADRAAASGGLVARHLAVRWAAKEAFVKAWSASIFGEPPVMGDEALAQVEVVCDAWGRPRLRLHAAVARHLAATATHVSLTHDGDHALAYVVLTR